MKYIRWDEYYDLAEELFETLGTINVPARFEYKGYPFGDWISRQRGIERKSGLNPARKKKLEALGIAWDGRKDNSSKKFLKMYSLLTAYKNQFGDTRVPQTYTVDGLDLGGWTASIREALRGTGRKALTLEQKALLDKIGFEANWYQENITASWEAYYSLVKEYAEKYGIEKIIESTTYKEKNIGNWIHTQRTSYKNGTLTTERYTRLYQIGLNFTPSVGKWDKAFSLAQLYFNELHNLDIPNDFIVQNFNLGRWISNQRQIYNGTRTDMKLSAEQIQKLESIGMLWKATGAGNTSFLEQAFLFYIRKIHPDTVTRDISYGIELDVYIPSIKFALEYDGSHWHKEKVEKDNQKDAICMNSGVRLIRIRETPLPNTASAVCYSTVCHHSNTTLSALIEKVLYEQFGIQLNVDVSRDSFDIIKDFQHLSGSSWYESYLEAKQYYFEHNSLMIPAAYISPTGKKLGSWIQSQRGAYKGTTCGHLSSNEVQLLESIGMVWDVRDYMLNQYYQIAKQHFNEYGNLLVKRNCIYHGVKLGRWINSQRNSHNLIGRRNLSEDRAKKLEAIGMVWNTQIP